MIHLIVPPIIVVFAVAILVVFLAKKISSENEGGRSFVVKNDDKKVEKKKKARRKFFRTKNETKKSPVKKTKKEEVVLEDPVKKKSVNGSQITQGIVSNANGDNVVSLRKKSMVSDKIENAEGRDPAEISLMKEIEENPQDSKKYEKLGDYYMEHEQFGDARECYKYVLRLDPRHKRAQVAMKNLDRVLE